MPVLFFNPYRHLFKAKRCWCLISSSIRINLCLFEPVKHESLFTKKGDRKQLWKEIEALEKASPKS